MTDGDEISSDNDEMYPAKGDSADERRHRRKLLWREIMNTPDKLKNLREPGWNEMRPVGMEW